jgi:Ras-related protein Rab-7A
VLDEKTVILQIWDTAGQERFQSLSSAFYRGADCCCLVYDCTKEDSFQALLNWKQIFLTKAAPADPETFPFVVIGNKVDLIDQKRVSTTDGQRFCA